MEYTLNLCGVCRMSINMACTEYLTIQVQISEKISVPINLCEDHARRYLEAGAKITKENFENIIYY